MAVLLVNVVLETVDQLPAVALVDRWHSTAAVVVVVVLMLLLEPVDLVVHADLTEHVAPVVLADLAVRADLVVPVAECSRVDHVAVPVVTDAKERVV